MLATSDLIEKVATRKETRVNNDDDGPTLDDYQALNLQDLDLEQLNLEPEDSFSPGRWLILISLLALVVFLVWFPNSDAYRMSPHGQTYFFLVSALAVIVGIFGGRWLWSWLEESAERYAQRAAHTPTRPPRVISATERWLTLLGALAGLITVAIFSGDHNGLPGQGSSGNWWLISLGAILSACLGGRWLFIQANRPHKTTVEAPPRELPKWFKWFTLSILIAGALFALIGSTLLGGGPSIFDSSTFGAVGLIVGTFGAIWMAKRFDELEKHFKDSETDK